MAISFSQVPANALVPFTYVELDAGRAGAGTVEFRSLLIGQRLAAGSVAAEVPVQVGDAADARAKFGAGSMLAIMAEAFRRQNPAGEMWAVALDDAGGATQGTTTITVSSAATGAGTISPVYRGPAGAGDDRWGQHHRRRWPRPSTTPSSRLGAVPVACFRSVRGCLARWSR